MLSKKQKYLHQVPLNPEAVDIEGDYKKDDPNFGERNVRAGDEDAQGRRREEEEEKLKKINDAN